MFATSTDVRFRVQRLDLPGLRDHEVLLAAATRRQVGSVLACERQAMRPVQRVRASALLEGDEWKLAQVLDGRR